MKNRGNSSSNIDGSNEVLTEEEQKKIIEDMKQEASQQADYFRKLFSLLFIIIALIFMIVAFLSFIRPFTLEHQRHFAELVPLEFFLIYYIGSAFCFIVAALVARNPQDTTLKTICQVTAYILGFFMFVTWTKIFYIHGVTNPVLYWIPLADMAALLLAQYVDFDAKGLVLSAEGLENYRYDHKSA
eukprot:gene7532-8130_t